MKTGPFIVDGPVFFMLGNAISSLGGEHLEATWRRQARWRRPLQIVPRQLDGDRGTDTDFAGDFQPAMELVHDFGSDE